jgi:chromate reductase
MLIVGISGSLRRDSYNSRLLGAAARKLPPGARFRVYDELAGIAPFDEDREDRPAGPSLHRLREAIGEADAVLISTPEYNSSFPGQLKNALDWVSRPLERNPLRGRPVAVVGASTGIFGAVWAQADLRRVLTAVGAVVLDVELAVGQAHAAFDSRDDLRDPALDTALAGLMEALVVAAAGSPPTALAAA